MAIPSVGRTPNRRDAVVSIWIWIPRLAGRFLLVAALALDHHHHQYVVAVQDETQPVIQILATTPPCASLGWGIAWCCSWCCGLAMFLFCLEIQCPCNHSKHPVTEVVSYTYWRYEYKCMNGVRESAKITKIFRENAHLLHHRDSRRPKDHVHDRYSLIFFRWTTHNKWHTWLWHNECFHGMHLVAAAAAAACPSLCIAGHERQLLATCGTPILLPTKQRFCHCNDDDDDGW